MLVLVLLAQLVSGMDVSANDKAKVMQCIEEVREIRDVQIMNEQRMNASR